MKLYVHTKVLRKDFSILEPDSARQGKAPSIEYKASYITKSSSKNSYSSIYKHTRIPQQKTENEINLPNISYKVNDIRAPIICKFRKELKHKIKSLDTRKETIENIEIKSESDSSEDIKDTRVKLLKNKIMSLHKPKESIKKNFLHESPKKEITIFESETGKNLVDILTEKAKKKILKKNKKYIKIVDDKEEINKDLKIKDFTKFTNMSLKLRNKCLTYNNRISFPLLVNDSRFMADVHNVNFNRLRNFTQDTSS
jgi:hypothetical protein